MKILAIDPGNEESAYTVIDETFKPIEFGKVTNLQLINDIRNIAIYHHISHFAIEMVGHYGTGMPAGKEIFDTCVWIGRFIQEVGKPVELIKRKTVVSHLCGSVKGKDGNVSQALIDRFAYGVPNHGKGYVNKKVNAPGWFYGFKADCWQAYAVGVTYLDKLKEAQP